MLQFGLLTVNDNLLIGPLLGGIHACLRVEDRTSIRPQALINPNRARLLPPLSPSCYHHSLLDPFARRWRDGAAKAAAAMQPPPRQRGFLCGGTYTLETTLKDHFTEITLRALCWVLPPPRDELADPVTDAQSANPVVVASRPVANSGTLPL
jgi:hypothetical protein